MTFSTFVKDKYGNMYEASKKSGVPLMYIRQFMQGSVSKQLINYMADFFGVTSDELNEMVNGRDWDKPQGEQMYVEFIYGEPFIRG